MRFNFSRRGIILIAAAVLAALGFRYFSTPARPEAAPAGPDVGVKQACAAGGKAGRADLDDSAKTSDGLRITVRTPSNYDPTRAYPLLVVYPPAGHDRRSSEIFYGITTQATSRGFIVAYSDHLRLSRQSVADQAAVAATVANLFCVDLAQIAYLGHSDGGSMAEGIPASMPEAAAPPRAIVASAAGVAREDLDMFPCPAIQSVLIVHNRTDARFPNFGRGAAAYWAQCGGCAEADLDALTEGCHNFSGCAEGRRVAYCETKEPHSHWPGANAAILDFIKGAPASRP